MTFSTLTIGLKKRYFLEAATGEVQGSPSGLTNQPEWEAEMAARKISQSEVYSQGLINYLKQASDVSRGNILLRQLGDKATLRREFADLHNALVLAEARRILVEWINGYEEQQRRLARVCEPKRLLGGEVKPPEDTTDLDPFFRSRGDSNRIRQAQSPSQRAKWALYFERFGCLLCGRKTSPHASNGMCHQCFQRTWARLRAIVTEPR